MKRILLFPVCVLAVLSVVSCATTAPFVMPSAPPAENEGRVVFVNAAKGDFYLMTNPDTVAYMDANPKGYSNTGFALSEGRKAGNLFIKEKQAYTFGWPKGSKHIYLYVYSTSFYTSGSGNGAPIDIEVESGKTKYFKISGNNEFKILVPGATGSIGQIEEAEATELLKTATTAYNPK